MMNSGKQSKKEGRSYIIICGDKRMCWTVDSTIELESRLNEMFSGD
jgi:hypothetical protein